MLMSLLWPKKPRLRETPDSVSPSCESTAELVLCRAPKSRDGKALDAHVRDANPGLVKRSVCRSVAEFPPLLLARCPGRTLRADVADDRQGQALADAFDIGLHHQDAGLDRPIRG